MARVAVAVAVVIALAAGVWILWPDDESGSTTTQPVAATSTTDIRPTTVPSTTTTTDADHIVDTVEEAEEILRDFWMGWYGGFFNKDIELIRQVVATDEEAETAESRWDALTFTRAPELGDFEFTDTEILLSTSDCLAIWSEFSPPFLEPPGTTSGVQVFRKLEGEWKSLSYWRYRSDLWEEDCSVVLP